MAKRMKRTADEERAKRAGEVKRRKGTRQGARRIAAAGLAIAFLLTVLAGCGSKAEPNASGQEPDGGVADEQPAEVIFFTNNGDSRESFDLRFGDWLRKKFPHYTIMFLEKEKGKDIAETIAAGASFDIFFHSIGNFEDVVLTYDLAYDMTELLQKHKVDTSRIEPTILQALKETSGGKMYALPVQNNNLVLYYNKSVFDKFGVPYPKDGMSWDETLDLAKKLTREEGGLPYFGLTHSPVHTVRLNPLSIPNADIASNTPTINKDERWKTFYDTLFVQPAQQPVYQAYLGAKKAMPDMNGFVNEQNIAMFAYLSSWINVWEQQLKKVDWDMVSLPSFKSNPGVGSPSYPGYFGITKISKNKDAAMKVLQAMISDEFQLELAKKGIMPVIDTPEVRKTFGQQSAFADKHLEAVFTNQFAPIAPKAPYDAALVNIYRNFGAEIQAGRMDMNTALRAAEEQAAKAIAEFARSR